MKKHDYDKILYRLTTIWGRLREGEILGTSELANEFNVSTKTIQPTLWKYFKIVTIQQPTISGT